MKKIFLILLTIMSFSVMADAPTATMESNNGNVSITFSDYENAVGFENYKCLVVFNRSWAYELSAVKQSNGKYKCLSQGALQSGVYYEVVIKFEDRPNADITYSTMLLLKAY